MFEDMWGEFYGMCITCQTFFKALLQKGKKLFTGVLLYSVTKIVFHVSTCIAEGWEEIMHPANMNEGVSK